MACTGATGRARTIVLAEEVDGGEAPLARGPGVRQVARAQLGCGVAAPSQEERQAGPTRDQPPFLSDLPTIPIR